MLPLLLCYTGVVEDKRRELSSWLQNRRKSSRSQSTALPRRRQELQSGLHHAGRRPPLQLEGRVILPSRDPTDGPSSLQKHFIPCTNVLVIATQGFCAAIELH